MMYDDDDDDHSDHFESNQDRIQRLGHSPHFISLVGELDTPGR